MQGAGCRVQGSGCRVHRQQAGYGVVTMDTQTERAATRVALDNAAQITNPSYISKGVRNPLPVRDSQEFVFIFVRIHIQMGV